VDVINRLPGKAAAVHWRGQTQMEMPYMDGTPLVTQCPIPSYTTFQYKFRASMPGTHLWHAHAGWLIHAKYLWIAIEKYLQNLLTYM